MDPAELDQILSGLPVQTDANLVVGISHKDDATVYRLPSGELLVQTVDFFTPVVDDAYDYGAIAAANSLSDVYAMNGTPLFALNICCFPRKYPAELWHEVLRGGAEKAMEAGIAIAGGHTVDDQEPKYGLVVTGLVQPGKFWANEGARPGDALILTKPLGTGIITTSLKSETVTTEEAADAIEGMKTLNRAAAEVFRKFEIHACTDITGNGLIGHAWEIAEASGVGLEFRLSAFPFYREARRLAETGKFPGGSFSNKQYFGDRVDEAAGLAESEVWLLFDAQTSGGLLAALPHEQAEQAVAELRRAGVQAATVVGTVNDSKRIRIVR
jgi:selenide, water dikinase